MESSAPYSNLLVEIQQALFDRALAFRNAHTFEPKNFDEFRQVVETGFARSYWCGDGKCEEQIKEATKATLRCIPLSNRRRVASAFFAVRPPKK